MSNLSRTGVVQSGDASHSVRAGILWMLATIFFFTAMDTLGKLLTQHHSPIQVTWARFFFHALWMLLLLRGRLLGALRTEYLSLQLLRGSLMVVANTVFIIGISIVPLVSANAIMMLNPLLATALSVPLLKEHVGPRRWACIAAGCVGAMIVIRPGYGTLQWAGLLPLTAACIFAIYQIATRKIGSGDPPLTSLLYTISVGAPVMTLIVPWFWTTPDWVGWLMMAGMGLLGALGHFMLIKAFSAASVAVVSPFLYTNLFWAALFGFFVFAEIPDLWTVVGALVIATSGWYAFVREQVARR